MPGLTSHQYQMVLGCLLGDAFLFPTKTGAWLRFTHGDKQLDYLLYKVSFLEPFPHSRLEGPYLSKNGGESYQVRFHSQPFFGDLYLWLYPQGVKVILLDHVIRLSDLGIACWFGDDGSVNRDKRCSGANDLAVLSMSSKYTAEHTEIQQWLENEFGEVHLNKNEEIWRFCFNVEASQQLGKRINPHLHALGLASKMIQPRKEV